MGGCIYFFYGDECPHCQDVKPYLAKIEKDYPDMKIHYFEVYHNYQNARLLQSFYESYSIPSKGIPILFIGDRYLQGKNVIQRNLKPLLRKFKHAPCPQPSKIKKK